jgi:hypothetical protein
MRLIDADRLKGKVLEWMPSDPCGIEEKEFPFETDIAVSLMMEIEEAPTIEPERQKGEWIGADSQCGIGCPFCGTPVDDFCHSIDYIDLDYKPNFCPNCGADLRGW